MTSARIAVLGLGFMGQRYAQIAADLPAAELVAVCDAQPDLAESTARRLNTRPFTDYRRLLEAGIADAWIVALPESAQVAPAIEAAADGAHLLVEKPVASRPEDAATLEAGLARTSGVHASGHLLRADPRYQAAAAATADQAFGQILQIRTTRRSRVGTAERVAGRTSLLYYLGVHDFDVVAWLSGSPVRSVYALGTRPGDWGLPVDASILVQAQCDNGAIAQLELTWAMPDSEPRGLQTHVSVVGSRGALSIGGGDELTITEPSGKRAVDPLHWPEVSGRVVGTLRYQVEQWVAAIRHGAPVAATIEDGLAASRVAFAVEESLRTGQPAPVSS